MVALFNVLRKLEMGEIMVNRIPAAQNTFRSLRLRSKIDLFAHLDQLREAIHIWKSTQKFLRSKVVKQNEDYFFAIDEDSSANKNLENVHFLRINSNLDSDLNKTLIDHGVLVELAIEKCASELILIDNNPELLWQLLVIEMKKESDEEQYCLPETC